MKLAMVMLLAVTMPMWWRETSSHASGKRGVREFEKKQYGASAKAFDRAQKIAPSVRGAFNLGTAEIAAGNHEQGSAHLAGAIEDPVLRADALFNRGNSALEAKALDHAIRDYSDALRANPNHAPAKRNLEIALSRKQNQRPSPNGQQGQGQQDQQPQKPQPEAGQKPGPSGQPDLDALLRSVQQQEQEELRRMKGRPAEGKVGW